MREATPIEVQWDEPIPFDSARPPRFPVDALPAWAADWVRGQAIANQVPQSLPAMLALGTMAAVLAGRARVEVKPGYTEPLNLFCVVALAPANRKSAVFAEAMQPLTDHEQRLADDARPHVARAKEEIQGLRAEMIEARKLAAKAGDDQAEKRARAADLAEKIAKLEHDEPVFPRLVCDDVTPEALGVLLQKHNGRMALFSPEGGELFEMAAGRYSQNSRPNLGVLLSGHSGDPIRVDRAKREPVIVANPALTIVAACQTSVIQGLAGNREFRGRGLLGRFLYAIPDSPLGDRDVRSSAVPSEVAGAYGSFVRELLDTPLSDRVVPLENDARERWFEFAEEIEPRLAEGGDLGQIGDWAGKLCGAVARLAGILHAMEWADRSDPFGDSIEDIAMERAIRLGHYFIDHAKIAFEMMGVDDEVEMARRVLNWVREERLGEFSRRDLYQQFKGGSVKKVADLEDPLALLVDHQCLRLKRPTEPKRKTGGRPSMIYEVNPGVLGR